MEKLYETLLQLPLFQGITLYDFNNLIGKLKWHFDKYQAGDTIVNSGDTCDNVICILSGETSSSSDSSQKTYSVTEFSDQPHIIEPYSLFGISNTYKSTCKAVSEVTIGKFTKLAFLTIVNEFIICRLNIINMLSNRSQNLYKRLWTDNDKNDFESRIIRFFLQHTETQEGKKMFRLKLYDFATLINISHVNVSYTLNQMAKEGLIKMGRMNIEIPDIAVLKAKYEG